MGTRVFDLSVSRRRFPKNEHSRARPLTVHHRAHPATGLGTVAANGGREDEECPLSASHTERVVFEALVQVHDLRLRL